MMAVLILSAVCGAAEAVAEQTDAPRAAQGAPGFIRLLPGGGASFGLTLVKEGQPVGPGFLSLRLEEAVRGAPRAEARARQARLWSIISFSAALVTVGLVTTDMVLYARDNDGLGGWPSLVPGGPGGQRSTVLGLAWVGTLNLTALSRFWAWRETVLSVDAYNHAVLEGRRAP